MTLTLDDPLLSIIYPAFIRTDCHDTLVAFGPAIARHVPGAAVGRRLRELFVHVGPGAGPESLREPVAAQVVRLADRRSGREFTGMVVRSPDTATYLLTPSPSGDGAADGGGFGVEDFPPGDTRLAGMITVSLQRALLEESRQLIDELVAARRTAESALRTQTEFLNGMSHQLRTPLASLVLYADPFAGSDDPEDQLRARACEALMSLKSKIDNLIDYTALRTGELRALPQWCDVERLRGGVRHLEQRALRKGLSFRWIMTDVEGRQVRIDPTLLDRLLDNLIDNAIESTAAGEIVVRFTLPEAGRLRVTISDSGAGVAAPWQTAGLGAGWERPQTSDNRTGIGIGLSVCRDIAAVLDGEVSMTESGPGGAAFTFEAPVEVR